MAGMAGTAVHGNVEIMPEAVALPELALLVVLGWYLLVPLVPDGSAVAAAFVAPAL